MGDLHPKDKTSGHKLSYCSFWSWIVNTLSSPLSLQLSDTAFDIVAIATSAGGLVALKQVLKSLPASFPAAIVIVQHLSAANPSMLAQILNRSCPLTVKQAEAGEQLQAGRVYVAPPKYHLLIQADGTLALTQTAPVNFTRPAADPLFESLAESFYGRAIAVVLTGMGKDGANGIKVIKQNGGVTIAEDVITAQFPGMPLAAIRTRAVDFTLPLEQIASKLIELVIRET